MLTPSKHPRRKTGVRKKALFKARLRRGHRCERDRPCSPAHEDFAIANLAGASGIGNGVHDLFDLRIFTATSIFTLDKGLRCIATAIAFDDLLASASAHVRYSHANDADVGEGAFTSCNLWGRTTASTSFIVERALFQREHSH
jgi:hypothetical protein